MLLPLPPTRCCLIAFAAGVIWLQQQALLPRWPFLWLGIGCFALIASSSVHRCHWRWRKLTDVAWIAVACSLGWGLAAWRAEQRLAEQLSPELEGKNLTVQGVIAELPQYTGQATRFGFRVEPDPANLALPPKITLAWYPEQRLVTKTDRTANTKASSVPQLLPGERWRLKIRLKRPHGLANPHGFDYEAWLLEQGYGATGYVVRSSENQKLADFSGDAREAVDRLRAHIKTRLERVLAEQPYLGVVVALAIGDQSLVTQTQWSDFNRTGIGHLISISGLHITLFATLLSGLVWQIWRRFTRLSNRLPAQKAALLCGFLGAWVYVLLAGSAIPAQRTLVMLGVAALGFWLNRPGTSWLVWLWALVVVLLLDPWASLSPGFWLSFAAVGLILYVTAETPVVEKLDSAASSEQNTQVGWQAFLLTQGTKWLHNLRVAARVQWAITLGLIPFSLVWFQSTSLISPLANAFAIPWVSFLVIPCVLLGAFSGFDGPLKLAHTLLVWLGEAIGFLSEQSWAVLELPASPEWAGVLGIGGVLLLLAPRGLPGRWLGWIWLLPMFFPAKKTITPGALELVVLDVGQGLSVLVRTHRHQLLYDLGPQYGAAADAGSRVIVPYLRGEGLLHVNQVVLSHQDQDHTGGLTTVRQAANVDHWSSSFPLGEKTPDLDLQKISWCQAGQHWQWDGVAFSWLYPEEGHYQDRPRKTNDLSCVLKIVSAGGTVLLTGDIEAGTESWLVARYGQTLRADVIVVPHHGSKTSSTEEFLAEVQPREAIFAVGYRNRFKHPHPAVVARYREAGSRVWRTDQLGAITVRFHAGEQPQLSAYRQEKPRYWREYRDLERSSAHQEARGTSAVASPDATRDLEYGL